MRYSARGVEIRSENAAKSVFEQSSMMLGLIGHVPRTHKVLDYGCGKLRYTIPLSKRAKSVVSVDSVNQVDRIQSIAGKRCTVREYVKNNLKNVTANSTAEKYWKKLKYDSIFLINVLPLVPSFSIRREILDQLAILLKTNGRLYVSYQETDMRYVRRPLLPNAEKYLDGWLVKDVGRNTFYGHITLDKAARLIEDTGLRLLDARRIDRTIHIVAMP